MLDKEELFTKFEDAGIELEEKCDSLGVKVKFEIECYSSPAMQNAKNIAARCAQYVNECFEAMDDSMRHWGDHTHCIEPVKIEVIDENDMSTDITNFLIDNYWIESQECFDISKIEGYD